MTRILQPSSQPALLTYSQIQDLIGQPHRPCDHCGGLEFSITHRGDWICCNCDPGRAFSSGIAVIVFLVEDASGTWISAKRETVLQANRIREAGGVIETIGESSETDSGPFETPSEIPKTIKGHQWAAWKTSAGLTCYADVDHFGEDHVIQAITTGREPTPW